ncbi:MAG: nucleotide exchange factor GrpE [Bacteroidia bacterium]|nr:nucleotide exchange factor GrpE [Bacteroidia bacterium]
MSTDTANNATEINNTPADANQNQTETATNNQPETATENNAELTLAQAEAQTYKDKFVRLTAEFDNYKRRTLRERMDLLKTANADLMIALLPVLDDFDRALKALSNDANQQALEGITIIHYKFKQLLEQKGLKAMDCDGKPFDVDLHEAITQVPAANESQSNTIMEVVEKGYFLEDKVIRHAKVVVFQ